MKSKKLTYSKEFSDFYNTYSQSEFPIISARMQHLLDTYNPHGTQLLDMGCGTGEVFKGLPKRYAFTGLDISEHMLNVAKKKFPKSKFYVADMSSFRLKKKFDAIICISDAINHLHNFSEWKQTFRNVSDHLKGGGVFIFDMNTPIRLKRLSRMSRYVSSMSNTQFFTVKVSHIRKSLYNFFLQIFTINKDGVSLHEHTILESSFDMLRVKEAVEKYFTIEAMMDIVRPKVSAKTGKVIFICKK